ncbi:SAM-dependent methyltransferase [Streptomyces sp. NPDC091280]|uniref:SAM-dependent methyltransferase n=1 Tax=Streptomyces sp. NPDC091280 TaxID=3365984 RepID=UPI00380D527F
MSAASSARMQEVLLGGVQHYRADRAACQALLEVLPHAAALAARSRSFLEDTVCRLARADTTQFVELGCGLPRRDNVHTIARRWQPDARTLYLDNDPVVLAHAYAELEESEQEAVTDADLNRTAVLDLPLWRSHFDPGRPVDILAVGLLEHLPDESVDTLICSLPAASTLTVSALACENAPRAAAIDEIMHQLTPEAWGRVRDAASLSALLPGLCLHHPVGDGSGPYLATGTLRIPPTSGPYAEHGR